MSSEQGQDDNVNTSLHQLVINSHQLLANPAKKQRQLTSISSIQYQSWIQTCVLVMEQANKVTQEALFS